MMDPHDKARAFAAAHRPGDPLVLVNVWDAGSARTVAAAGAKALATGSWSVADAHGYADAEGLPLDLALANLARMVAAVDLPVSLDFERGYGRDATEVGASVARVVAAGAVGINLEDGTGAGAERGVRPLEEAAARIAAARAAAGQAFFINARTDVFLVAPAPRHDAALVEEALVRARSFAAAGASGLFVPGLVREDLIAQVCAGAPLPVNIMHTPAAPTKARLAELGVARISLGPGPYRAAMAHLADLARGWFE